MGKYNKKTQKLALKLAEAIKNSKEGFTQYNKHKLYCLKDIQTEIGPNPLAIKRYAIKFDGNIQGVPRRRLKKNQIEVVTK